MKGIILAGGTGSRLFPITLGVSKQMLPVYDKPMIYYPLSTLMLADLKDILIISSPKDLPSFQRLLGDGSQWGIKLTYKEQLAPKGLAEALILGEDFLAGDECCLILGDNLFYGMGLSGILERSSKIKQGAQIFSYVVKDPGNYGVVEFDPKTRKAISLEEKPKSPRSQTAVPGIYFYDAKASEYAKKLKPSPRGELEITDLNRVYMEMGQLIVEPMSRGTAWLDTGSPESLLQASQFIFTIESRQGLKVGSPDEVALRKGWISVQQAREIAKRFHYTAYGQSLEQICVEFGKI